jgi:site-specific DNA-methyltransferase (adenine-specific)
MEDLFDTVKPIKTTTLLHGNNLDLLRTLPDNSVDAIVTDPPYGLGKEPDALAMLRDWMEHGHHDVKSKKGFMGKEWDNFVPQPAQWKECLRVLKPGGHVLAFAGTRTQDLMALGLRIAGFEIRDLVAWIYGSGFPKVKTVLKPALEPITLARKPGKSELQIDLCRVGDFTNTTPSGLDRFNASLAQQGYRPGEYQQGSVPPSGKAGRWPANVIHDGSDEVVELFPQSKGQLAASRADGAPMGNAVYGAMRHGTVPMQPRGDSGSAARFFYCAKASKKDREGSTHPTVKPTDLMRYLCRLVTPPGGTILDPWMGSGSTGKAAKLEGFDFIGMEQDAEYFKIAQARCGITFE